MGAPGSCVQALVVSAAALDDELNAALPVVALVAMARVVGAPAHPEDCV